MRNIVCKFGGSSTASAVHLRKILRIVQANPARRCIVLSAPGADGAHCERVTTLLEECWNKRNDPIALPEVVSRVESRFSELSKALSLPAMDEEAREEIMNSISISRPHLLSRGEYLCARLFSRFSGIPFIDAAKLIAFDGNGKYDERSTEHRFRDIPERFDRVVMPGFYGADALGEIHIFPRNGSDISGALAAVGWNAGLYENWTDVDGLLTADPAIVSKARLIPQVSYSQMRALSRAGARVLHPDCLDPVSMAGIPTRLRNTMNPDCFGTLIDDHMTNDVPCIAGTLRAALPGSLATCVARICVFGVAGAKTLETAAALKPIRTVYDGRSMQIFVEARKYEDSVRWLHQRLII